MHGVSHFMEHSDHIIKADKCRLAFRRFWQVCYIYNHRFAIQQMRLGNKGVHPGPSILGITLKIVSLKDSRLPSLRVIDIKYSNIGMIDWHAIAFSTGD